MTRRFPDCIKGPAGATLRRVAAMWTCVARVPAAGQAGRLSGMSNAPCVVIAARLPTTPLSTLPGLLHRGPALLLCPRFRRYIRRRATKSAEQ